MTNFTRKKIEDIQDGRDGWARTAFLTVDDKTIRTPSVCTPLSRAQIFNDLELRLRIEGQTKGFTGCYVVRGFDYDRIMREPMSALNQSNLTDGGYSTPILRDYLLNNVFVYDPSAESMEYYWHLNKLSMARSTPPKAQRLCAELADLQGSEFSMRKAAVYRFWCELNAEKKDMSRLTSYVYERASVTGANIMLPFMIVVRNAGSFAIAKQVNEYWIQQTGSDNRLTVAYLLLAMEAFRNHDLITEICQWVEKLDADYVVLKVKNADFSIAEKLEQRDEYGRLLLAFARLRNKHYKKVTTIALDCGNQLFLNAIKSFDIVATSMTASDVERPSKGGADPIPFGRALELDDMIALPGYYWKKKFSELGQMACNHEYCHANITSFEPKEAMPFNNHRCAHNMLITDEWMAQISEGIINGEAKLIPQKLHKSALRVLGSVVPAEGTDAS